MMPVLGLHGQRQNHGRQGVSQSQKYCHQGKQGEYAMLDFLSTHSGYVGFIVGVFVGAPIGVLAVCLLQMAAIGSRSQENDEVPKNPSNGA